MEKRGRKSRKSYHLNDIWTRPIQPPRLTLECFDEGQCKWLEWQGTIEGAERKKVFGKVEGARGKVGGGWRE